MAYSASRCSGARLCVMAQNRTLSVSVTVRRVGWSKTIPGSNSSKCSPGMSGVRQTTRLPARAPPRLAPPREPPPVLQDLTCGLHVRVVHVHALVGDRRCPVGHRRFEGL